MSVRVEHHKDLVVWNRAMALAVACYKATSSFPNHEQFGLVSQIRRSASSVPANIAEGAARVSSAEFARFVSIARGSIAEPETHMLLSRELGYIADVDDLLDGMGEIRGMLVSLHRILTRRADRKRS